MTARVIDLRSRAEYVPNLVRSTRERLGLSQDEFAAALTARLSWTARPGMVKAWEGGTDWPSDVSAACRTLAAAPGPATPGPVIAGEDDATTMRAFRTADLRHGGGYLYPLVLRYMTEKVAPRLFSGTGPTVFTAAAALSDMAGWMAHDAGHDVRARDHFARAWQLANVSGDRQVTAHVLASNGHLAHHMGDAAEAIRASHAGLAALAGGPRTPGLEARLYAIEARGFAALREPAEAALRLTLAERALEAGYDEPLSEWVSTCDEGTLAGEAARCLRQLGELGAAQRQAERVIELRPATGPAAGHSACSSAPTPLSPRASPTRPCTSPAGFSTRPARSARTSSSDSSPTSGARSRRTSRASA